MPLSAEEKRQRAAARRADRTLMEVMRDRAIANAAAKRRRENRTADQILMARARAKADYNTRKETTSEFRSILEAGKRNAQSKARRADRTLMEKFRDAAKAKAYRAGRPRKASAPKYGVPMTRSEVKSAFTRARQQLGSVPKGTSLLPFATTFKARTGAGVAAAGVRKIEFFQNDDDDEPDMTQSSKWRRLG